MALIFPESAAGRDAWIIARRPARRAIDARVPHACFVEEECSAAGEIERVATILLTNRECPFRCTMCDLWRNTLTESVAVGAIPDQIKFALRRLKLADPESAGLEPAQAVKLYNSGSFFDPRAIPPADYPAIARLVRDFNRVIVECHPAFVGEACVAFRDLLTGQLEIAMGLETVQAEVLHKLNKRMTLDQFAAAARFLRENAIELRTFILVQPPFMKPEEALLWAERSLDFAASLAATAATLIPTRGGNGAMEELAAAGLFAPPRLSVLEEAAVYGLGLGGPMRVFSDLWELQCGALQRSSECAHCFDLRVRRLREMNLRQHLIPRASCNACGYASFGQASSAHPEDSA